MLKQLCIKCGRTAKVNNLCGECFLQQPLFDIRDFRIIVCGRCGSYYDNGWHKKDFNEAVREQVIKRIKTGNKIIRKNVTFRVVGNKIVASIECSGTINGRKKTEKKRVAVTMKRQKCDSCIKKSGGYYEAVLQARGGNAEDILKNVKSILADMIISTGRVKNGYDIKVMDKKLAAKAVKGYDVKKTFKLVGEKKGKKLVRDYYAIR